MNAKNLTLLALAFLICVADSYGGTARKRRKAAFPYLTSSGWTGDYTWSGAVMVFTAGTLANYSSGRSESDSPVTLVAANGVFNVMTSSSLGITGMGMASLSSTMATLAATLPSPITVTVGAGTVSITDATVLGTASWSFTISTGASLTLGAGSDVVTLTGPGTWTISQSPTQGFVIVPAANPTGANLSPA